MRIQILILGFKGLSSNVIPMLIFVELSVSHYHVSATGNSTSAPPSFTTSYPPYRK